MLAQTIKVDENTLVENQNQDFISSPKLYLICTQKFKPDVMLKFFRPLGALTVTGRKKEPVVSSAEITFDSCTNAEKAFAIWHCRYTVPFQGRIFFSRNADPASREAEPISPRIQAEGFSIDSSEFEIFDFFRPIGPIFSCLIEHSKKAEAPIIIVHYFQPDSASKALEQINNTQFRGEKIKIQILSEQNALAFQSKPSPPVAVETYCVSVKGFPITSEVSFRDFFLKAGVILNCQFDQATGSGRVEYETALGVFNATSKFNNFKLKNSTIIVKNNEGEDSPEPHAVIPLYSNNSVIKEVSIPTSRNASQSRWSSASNDKPSQETSKRKQRDDFKIKGEMENKIMPSTQENSLSNKTLEKTTRADNIVVDKADDTSSSLQEKANLNTSENKDGPQQKIPEPFSLQNTGHSNKSSPNVPSPTTKLSWEEFSSDKSYDVISNITKGLSPAANHIQEKMIKSIFNSSPDLINRLTNIATEFNNKLAIEEDKYKAKHEFCISNEAYHAMLRSFNESELEVNLCNPEYFPLYPSKETYLNQLMSLPIDQSQPIMASMIEKRLKEMDISEHSRVSNELAQKCPLRLIMVSYYYDDVLVELLQKHFPDLDIKPAQ